MKDLYMTNLMNNNNGSENSLDDCPIVMRFRKNYLFICFKKEGKGKMTKNCRLREDEDLCTQEELQDAQVFVKILDHSHSQAGSAKNLKIS